MEQILKTQAAFTMGYIAASAQGYPIEEQAKIAARSLAQACPEKSHLEIIEAIHLVLADMVIIPIGKTH